MTFLLPPGIQTAVWFGTDCRYAPYATNTSTGIASGTSRSIVRVGERGDDGRGRIIATAYAAMSVRYRRSPVSFVNASAMPSAINGSQRRRMMKTAAHRNAGRSGGSRVGCTTEGGDT